MKKKIISAFVLAMMIFQVTSFANNSVSVGEIGVNRREIQVNFSVSGLTTQDQVTILIYKLEASSSEPDENNIVFIDQIDYENNLVGVSLQDKVAAGTYRVMMGGTGVKTASIGEFTLKSLLLGDVNGDGIVDTDDAVWVLRYSAGLEMSAGINILEGDINQDSIVDTDDAVWILRWAAGLE